MDGLSLNRTLDELKLTTRPAGHYAKHIVNRYGETVFTGNAFRVWFWLHENFPSSFSDD